MRRSVKDPGWSPERDGGKVYVDSVLVEDVVAFDDVEGWADVQVRDANGKWVRNAERTGIEIKRVHGSIRFEPHRKS